jgi:hypothetical protein
MANVERDLQQSENEARYTAPRQLPTTQVAMKAWKVHENYGFRS